MECATYVRRHICMLARTQIFTSRELLGYGSRSAVDQALCRLVKVGFITRLARGVFIRDFRQSPSAFEIATAKAWAFGKRIVKHAADTAREKGLLPEGNAGPTFHINGCTSSFLSTRGRIQFKQLSERKTLLGDTRVGQGIRALWYLGPQHLKTNACILFDWHNRFDRFELRVAACWMPGWMSADFTKTPHPIARPLYIQPERPRMAS